MLAEECAIMGAHQVSCQDGIPILTSTVVVIVAGGGINARILNGFLYIKSSIYLSGALDNYINHELLELRPSRPLLRLCCCRQPRC